MKLFGPGIVQPNIQIRFYIDLPHPVKGHDIKFPNGFIILGL